MGEQRKIQPREGGKPYWEHASRVSWERHWGDPEFDLDHVHGKAERALYWAYLDLRLAEQRIKELEAKC